MVNKNSGAPPLPDISRRDFVNGTLVGFGSALVSSPAPARFGIGSVPRLDGYLGMRLAEIGPNTFFSVTVDA